MGERVGLDYTSVISVINLYGHPAQLLEQVRYMELGALTAYNGKELETILDG